MTRVHFSFWGKNTSRLAVPSYAVQQPGESPIEAVARSVARASRLDVCGGPRSEGTALDSRWQSEASHYAMTFGRPCRGGGHSPVAELWVSIPTAGGGK